MPRGNPTGGQWMRDGSGGEIGNPSSTNTPNGQPSTPSTQPKPEPPSLANVDPRYLEAAQFALDIFSLLPAGRAANSLFKALKADWRIAWRFGSKKSAQKWSNRYFNRKWTVEEINNVIENGIQTRVIMLANAPF